MFETSFNIDAERKKYIDFLYDGLKNCIKDTSSVVAYNVVQDRVFLSLACEDRYARILKDKIVDLLTEIYSFGFKYDYLKKHLNIYKESLLTKTLLNTMTVFDSNNDKKLIKKELSNSEIGSIDGYFNFRLKAVKEKWDEIINLTNENSVVFSDDEIAGEFLMFLLDAIPQSEEGIKIGKFGGKIELFDKFGKKIQMIYPLGDRCEGEEAVLFNLVCIAPKKVVVIGEKDFSKEFLVIIKKFF